MYLISDIFVFIHNIKISDTIKKILEMSKIIIYKCIIYKIY